LSLVKVLPSLIKMLMIALIVWLGRANLTWNFWAFALVPIATFIIAFAYTDKKPLFEIKSTPGQFSDLFHVSKWIALSALANSFLGQADVLMTRSMAGVEELARLAGGQKLSGMMPILSTSITTVMLPKVASMAGKKELNFFFRKVFLFTLPIGLALFCFLPLSKYVIPFILGEKYIASIEVFNIYMIGHVIGLMVSPHSIVLYKLNKENYLALMNLVQLVLTIACNLILIPEYGAVGAAISFILTKVIAVIMIYYQLWKEGILSYYE
jgi:O-antigen/teichoic acid export membrane protein